MIVAVEPSADDLGGGLAVALRERLGASLRLVGVGGPKLAAQGLRSAFDPSALAVVGLFNAVAAYPEVLRRAGQAGSIARVEHPDVAVLIDAWGFNLRVARALRAADRGLPLVKYVAPQVWATRPGRARTLARTVDKLLTIRSFDTQYFLREGLETVFVGNPALNRDFSTADPMRFRGLIGASPEAPILLLLPGSRIQEIDRLIPVFDDAVVRVRIGRENLRVVLAVAPGVAERVKKRVGTARGRVYLVEGEQNRQDAMRAATVALACSGTVTTELALAGCPMVVAYKLGPLTGLIVRRLLRTPYITLFNVAAGSFVAPERTQGDCTGKVLAADLARLLDNASARVSQIEAQTAALALMRGGVDDPIAAAADAVIAAMRPMAA